MSRSKKYNHMLHPGQIPTTLKYIKWELSFKENRVLDSLIACMVSNIDSPEYKNHLIMVAMLFERFSCLVYKGRNGKYRKPKENLFKNRIFERRAETPDEVQDIILRYVEKDKQTVSSDLADKIYRMTWQVADIVCPMMTCMGEQAFLSEYAYAIDYVIRHEGNLEKPVMDLLFPQNYSDFNYSEGIASEVEKYEFV